MGEGEEGGGGGGVGGGGRAAVINFFTQTCSGSRSFMEICACIFQEISHGQEFLHSYVLQLSSPFLCKTVGKK